MKLLYYFTAFTTGACVLILEVLNTRILSPYFGNSIYSISSMLSVSLGGLSIGYWYGGKIADKIPNAKTFYLFVIASSISIFLSKLFTLFLLPHIAYSLPTNSGPMITSLAILLIPCIFLGFTSPYVIKLTIDSTKSAGTISGKIFFYSTLGSIFGSLVAGFYLIPFLGINQTLNILIIVLFLLGSLGIYLIKKTTPSPTLLLPLLTFFIVPIQTKFKSIDSLYGTIQILDARYKNQPTRFLIQDHNSSAAMFINSPELVFDYTKYIDMCLSLTKIDRALVIGTGAYSIPKWLKENTKANIDTVDIEPMLYDLSKKYFNLSHTPNIHTITADGRKFLTNTSNKYDLVFVDAYSDHLSIPTHLTTKEFFQILKTKLSNNSMVIANVVGKMTSNYPSGLLSQYKTIKSVFPHTYLYAVSNPKDLLVLQNYIVIFSLSEIDFKNPYISKYTESLVLNISDSGQVLTDDLNPIQILNGSL